MPSISQRALDPDTAFALLSNQRRRHVLCLLAERDEELPLGDVAREIAARMNDVEPEAVEEGTYRSVYVALYQNHVPRLDEVGVVEYDADERTARIAKNRKTWELLQYAGVDCDRSWSHEYLLTGGAALLVTPISLGLPMDLFPEWWFLPFVALVSALTMVSAVQYTASFHPSVEDCHSLVDYPGDGS